MLYKSIFFLTLVFTVYYLTSLPQENPFVSPKDITTEASVLRVVDGDTILASLELKGSILEEKIRVIGINTPETVDPRRPVECFGKEASEKANELLENKEIILENFSERDKHGRILAYIKVEGEDFGAKMISEGYAYSFKSYPHDRLHLYNNLENKAQENKVGLWEDGVCE